MCVRVCVCVCVFVCGACVCRGDLALLCLLAVADIVGGEGEWAAVAVPGFPPNESANSRCYLGNSVRGASLVSARAEQSFRYSFSLSFQKENNN